MWREEGFQDSYPVWKGSFIRCCQCPTHIPSVLPEGHLQTVPMHSDSFLCFFARGRSLSDLGSMLGLCVGQPGNARE